MATLCEKSQVLKAFHMSATTLRVRTSTYVASEQKLKTLAVFPDHLGNNQRLFDKYGPVFKSTNMGKTVCQTNDPTIGQIVFTESEFFSKEINDDHPLRPIKQDAAGVFVSDTSNP